LAPARTADFLAALPFAGTGGFAEPFALRRGFLPDDFPTGSFFARGGADEPPFVLRAATAFVIGRATGRADLPPEDLLADPDGRLAAEERDADFDTFTVLRAGCEHRRGARSGTGGGPGRDRGGTAATADYGRRDGASEGGP